MADWNWHIGLAKQVLNHTQIENQYDFLLGSIIPDIPWMDVDDCIELRDKLHLFRLRDNSFGYHADLSKWMDKYVHEIRKYDLFKGALTHMILDSEVNTALGLLVTYDNVGACSIFNQPNSTKLALTIDEVAERKWRDLERFSLDMFGVQTGWLFDDSFKLSQDASNLLVTCFNLPYAEQSSMNQEIVKRVPTKPREVFGPTILDEELLLCIHDLCVLRCLNYLNLLAR